MMHVGRFWDLARVSLTGNGGETHYMTAKSARQAAAALIAVADEIERADFGESTVGTARIESFDHGRIGEAHDAAVIEGGIG